MTSTPQRRFRLAFVQRALDPGWRISGTHAPAERHGLYRDSLIDALERKGVSTQTIRPRTKLLAAPPREGRVQAPTRGILVSPRFIVDLVRSRTEFIVCVEYGFDTFLTLLVARLLGRRALVLQEHVGRAGVPLSFLDTRYRRLIGRLASGVVANTVAAEDEILGLLHVDRTKVFRVNYLVAPDRDELCRGPLRMEPPRFRPLFLFVGRLIPLKNVEVVLRAARLLRDEGHEFEVWIAGRGPEQERLTDLVGEFALDDLVRFAGSVPYWSVGHLYEACDVFVMPSRHDYRSVAVLEAMRFGKPVIDSARDGNAHDSARDGLNAFIFDPDSASDLAGCMRTFIVDPSIAREMGARSRAMIASCTPDAAARGLVAAFEQIEARA